MRRLESCQSTRKRVSLHVHAADSSECCPCIRFSPSSLIGLSDAKELVSCCLSRHTNANDLMLTHAHKLQRFSTVSLACNLQACMLACLDANHDACLLTSSAHGNV